MREFFVAHRIVYIDVPSPPEASKGLLLIGEPFFAPEIFGAPERETDARTSGKFRLGTPSLWLLYPISPSVDRLVTVRCPMNSPTICSPVEIVPGDALLGHKSHETSMLRRVSGGPSSGITETYVSP